MLQSSLSDIFAGILLHVTSKRLGNTLCQITVYNEVDLVLQSYAIVKTLRRSVYKTIKYPCKLKHMQSKQEAHLNDMKFIQS